jgi:hypothetical protein
MIYRNIWRIIFLGLLVNNIFAADEIPFLQNEYESAKWPISHLKLSQAATLKEVFDSGLRPYRFPGCETTTLEVKHLRLITHLRPEKILPEICVEWINISMFDDGQISQIEGTTPQLSLQDAKVEMMKWLSYGGRSEKDLDDYLKAVEADPLNFDDPYRGFSDGYGVGWKEPEWSKLGGGAHCGLGFRKTFSNAQPLALHFSFSWSSNRPLKDANSYEIPIPPPPGYENVSMKAPEKFGPDSGVDINRSKGINMGESEEGKQTYGEYRKNDRATVRTNKRNSSSSTTSSNTTSEVIPFRWWTIAGSITLILMLLVAWIKLRRTAKE